MCAGHAKAELVLVLVGGAVVEEQRPVTQTHADAIFIRDVFDCQDHSGARDVLLLCHGLAMVDPYQLLVLLVQNNLVYLLEIVDLLDVVIVNCRVLDVRLVF